MRLHRLHIEGFGMFDTPQEVEFDPYGLTVVYGDNEVGKTTIKDAICATLFGFKTNKEKNLYQPWSPSAHFETALLLSSKGDMYSISRDFTTDTVTIHRVSEPEKIIFQGCIKPRGRGIDYELYSDFLQEIIGFSTLDIFQLTTLVEQMGMKTEISQEIRQLISGAEKTDYIQIAHNLESQLKDLTKSFPGSKLIGKRKIEEIEERISILSRAIGDAHDRVIEVGHCQSEIKKTETQLQNLQKNYDTEREGLEALQKYIQNERDLLNAQKELRIFEKELQTFSNLKKSIDAMSHESHLTYWMVTAAIFVATVAVSSAVWILFNILSLTIIILISGIVLGVISYFLSVSARLSSKVSRLREVSIHSSDAEEMKTEYKRLQEEILYADSLKQALLSEYPSFAQAGLTALTEFQGNVRQKMKDLEEKIRKKEEELLTLNVTLERCRQDVTECTSMEEERAALQERLMYLKRKKKALIVALSVLQECSEEYQHKYIDKLEDLLSRSFRKITNEKYDRVTLEKNTLEPLLCAHINPRIRKESLSVGAQEQLYFAMRLSVAYLLSQNIALPFLLDDPFVHYDRRRLENARFILSRVKQNNQIILFAHDPLYTEWTNTVINLNEWG